MLLSRRILGIALIFQRSKKYIYLAQKCVTINLMKITYQKNDQQHCQKSDRCDTLGSDVHPGYYVIQQIDFRYQILP